MDVVAVTLAGGNREALIGDAIRSALPIVDRFLLLRTDETADAAIKVAVDIAGADRCVVRDCPIPIDCGKSRTIGLQLAAELGADWAMILDTDERIVTHGEDLRAILETTTHNTVVTLREETGADAKERFIRLPAHGIFHGRVHEYYTDFGSRYWCRKATFSELPHTKEEQDAANVMVEQAMLEQIAEEPKCSRWHYYLGDARWRQQDTLGAIEAWQRCAEAEGPDEQRAWACLRSAAGLAQLGQHEACLRWCCRGVAIHSGMAELFWLAAQACLNLGRLHQAEYFCYHAIHSGRFAGFGGTIPTRVYALTRVLYEAPFETLEKTLRAAGKTAEADEAAKFFEQATQARLAA